MEPNQEKPNILMRIAVIAGIVIILIIVAFGIIRLVPKALSSLANVSVSFSSLFSPKEAIAVTLSPSSVKSGEKTSLSFTHNGKTGNGFYALSYVCQGQSAISYQSGTKLVTIPCGMPYPFSSANNTLALIATDAPGTTVQVPISISYQLTSSSTAITTGSATLTINPGAGIVATSTPSNNNGGSVVTNPPTQTGNTNPGTGTTGTTGGTTGTNSNPNGHADLAVQLVAAGITDPTTGVFVPTSTFNAGNTVVIKFQVTNIGDKSTGSWSFQTNQPMTNPSDSIKSESGIRSLAPGQSTGPITLALSGIQANGGVVTIAAVDSYVGSEIQTANNTLSVTIPAGTGYNGNGGGYNNGAADLSVQILDTGTITNGYYVQTNTVRSTDTVRVHFVVRNLGGVASGQYTISATTPGSNNYNNGYNNGYNNNNNNLGSYQPSIPAGGSADFYITVSGLQQGNGNVTITANSNGYGDVNTANNSATTYLNVTY